MRKTANILGVPIDIVTLASALDRVKELIEMKNGCSIVTTPNSEIVMAAYKDPELTRVLAASDLCIPDGIGLIYASKINRLGLKERVPGVDLMKKVLEYANEYKKSVFVLGGKPGIAEIASNNINKVFPDIEIKGFRDGYFSTENENEIIDLINEGAPDILFVALGAPRQEKWMFKHRESLNVKIAMGVGGSVDIWAGTAKRAPLFFQQMGLEWFYRLLKEPWRFRRMMALPKFMMTVLLKK